jgi:metal-responsive CopG/Arc/MetJ family transcriptional regulator
MPTSVIIPKEMEKQIEAIAKLEDRSKSQVIRLALKNMIENSAKKSGEINGKQTINN